MIRVFTAEFQQERRPVVRGFKTKVAALAWARERAADETIGAVNVWEVATDAGALDALVIAAEGKPWYVKRTLVGVVTRPTVRVTR